METYSATEVEAKWQSRWDELGTNLFSREDLASAEKTVLQPHDVPLPIS